MSGYNDRDSRTASLIVVGVLAVLTLIVLAVLMVRGS